MQNNSVQITFFLFRGSSFYNRELKKDIKRLKFCSFTRKTGKEKQKVTLETEKINGWVFSDVHFSFISLNIDPDI